jgi:hypothetical protein
MARSGKEPFSLSIRTAARLGRAIGPRSQRIFARRLKNPVFMVGCGRSGTSLLANILSTHPAIAAFPNEANDLWHTDLYPWHRSQAGLPPIWIDPHGFSKHSLKRLDWRKIASIFGAFQFLARRPVFLNKSVMLSFMLKDIARQFEHARFIHMYRDGRAVALSYAKKNLPKIRRHPTAYALAGVSDDRDALMYLSYDHWMAHIEAVEKADREEALTAKGRLLEFSYEQLSQEPDRYLGLVLEFMGVENYERAFVPQTTIENRNYKVFDELTPSQLERLLERGSTILERKGYTASLS